MDSVDDTNFSQFKQKWFENIVIPIDAVPVDFGTSYSSFDEKRRDLHRKYQSNYSKEEAQASLRVKLSAESGSNYHACLDAFVVRTQQGLHLWASRVTDDGVTIVVKFTSPPGESKSLNVVLTQLGLPDKTIALPTNGSVSLPMDRNPHKEIRIAANGQGYTDEIVVPKVLEVTRIEPPHVQLCACKGQGGVNGVTLWQPKGTLCGGLFTPPAQADCAPESTRIASCIGRGGVNGVHLWGPEGNVCGGLWPDRHYDSSPMLVPNGCVVVEVKAA